jgi:hypothetical protein
VRTFVENLPGLCKLEPDYSLKYKLASGDWQFLKHLPVPVEVPDQ